MSQDPIGGIGWHRESGRNSQGVFKLRFILETPENTQRAIHHICISICKLTSHTQGTLNKLHSERKHAPHWSLMCALYLHTRPRCVPQPSRCVCGLLFRSGLSLLRLHRHNAPEPCTVFHGDVNGFPMSCFLFKHWQIVTPSNLPCSLPHFIPSPHCTVCFSNSKIHISTIPTPSIHLLRLSYSLSLFSSSQPLLQRECRTGKDLWTVCAEGSM